MVAVGFVALMNDDGDAVGAKQNGI